ncbi:MAG: MBL fold metallo-hydrolase [Acidithiobacillales bacterium SG8_45]|jgi:hydroxyacylglutathione hydrolase|nr:MAG: MBL fold metallo-hydrolase [Acidithiobacillales bacterium SG8_45]
MFFSQLPTKESSLSYLFGCGGKGKAIAVDIVAGDEVWFIEQAKQRDVTITHVIDTHVHADHYSGGKALAAKIGAPYCLHENSTVDYEVERLHDNQVIEVGNVSVTVLHTPGHTYDSICLLVSDKRRSDEPWFILTGDTLFVGAVGRPDLAGKEYEMAGTLFDSIHERILTLPDNVEIYPGHQAGSACGAGISGKPSSTVGFEKKFNPMLSMDRTAFVAALTSEIPPRPANMDRIVAANVSA